MMIAEIFSSRWGGKDRVKEQERKPRKPVTRALKRTDQVLDYCSLTKSNCQRCAYFHSILESSAQDATKCNSEEVENFIVNISLPLPVTGSMEISSRRRRTEKKRHTFPAPVGVIEEAIAGSSSEGLWLPQITHIRGKSYFTDTPDEDRKYIFTELIVSSKRERAFAIPERSPFSPPTFINLRYNKKFMTGKATGKTSTLLPETYVGKDGLINRIKFVSKMKSILKKHIYNYKKEVNSFKCKDSEPKVTFSQHGPAITVEIEDVEMKQQISTDYVICLPYPQWPEQAQSWQTRQRIWPEKCIVRKIVREGCHVVPKAFKQDSLRNTEFLLSFSLCDRKLAQYLSLIQKRCYMLFKILFKYCLNKVHRGLTSYHCKTTFFWLCERKTAVKWREDNTLECILELFGDLKLYLSRHNLPHYYIQDNNIISEISKKVLDACVKDIEKVMEFPAPALLKVSENHRLSFLSRDVSLQNILQPLLVETDITKRLVKRYLLSFLSEMLDKGEVRLVIACICQEWATDANVKTDRLIQVLKQIVEAEEATELEDCMVCFFGLLANLYHQKANESLEEYGTFGNYMDKCMDIYYKIFDHVGRHIWIYGAAYDCLYEVSAYQEIIIHFLAKVNSECTENSGRLYEAGIYTTISVHNQLTTYPEDFANILDTVAYPATAYILHKVTYAYMALSKTARTRIQAKAYKSEATKVLTHLEKWVRRKCELYPEIEDDAMYYLLGLTANEVGNARISRASFNEALKYGTTFHGFEIFHEPQFDDDDSETVHKHVSPRERMKTRSHPYRRGKSTLSHLLPAKLRFKGGDFKVGPYLHG